MEKSQNPLGEEPQGAAEAEVHLCLPPPNHTTHPASYVLPFLWEWSHQSHAGPRPPPVHIFHSALTLCVLH